MHRKGATGYKGRMSALLQRLALLFVVLVPLMARAAAPATTPMEWVRIDRWAEADAAASQLADPTLSRKLVTYYRLLTPGAANVRDIAGFMAANPDWPQQDTLARRRDEALTLEMDDAVVLPLCRAGASGAALLRCADAFGRTGRVKDAQTAAQRAWIAGIADPAVEKRFLASYTSVLTPDVLWRRFDRLAWTDTAAATNAAARLTGPDRAAAEARLAFRRDDPTAANMLAAVTQERRRDPGLVLEQARGLRRAGQDAAAVALWLADGSAAERAAPAERRVAFWDERNLLARRRLRQADVAGAYALVLNHAQTAAEQAGDAAFLAGFIALRRQNEPAQAVTQFASLASSSRAAVTQGRAHYWLGRALEAKSDIERARAEYAAAAAWPSTFYGQLSALRLGEDARALAARISAAHDPQPDPVYIRRLADNELARATVLLVGWGELRRAASFVIRLAEVGHSAGDQAGAAQLAAGLGLSSAAVAIARRTGRDGVVLPDAGWPIAVDVADDTAVEQALVLGVIRQESSFDTSVISPAGARGLMQLMPATAAMVGKRLGALVTVQALIDDPALNMRLGTAYLHELMGKFDNAVPLVVAAYNAGPSRVTEWLGVNGDIRGDDLDVIDWIELIPFNETRNYVQRVIENQVVYRAKRGVVLPHPLARWLK